MNALGFTCSFFFRQRAARLVALDGCKFHVAGW
jgi:hypothetical protein